LRDPQRERDAVKALQLICPRDVKETNAMTNENAGETKSAEMLTAEALEQVTGGNKSYATKRDYDYCPIARITRRT